MIVSESVLLPEPFGPIIACTEPLSTVRSMPFRIGLPSTLTLRPWITRSDNAHTLPRLLFREVREVHPVQRLRDGRLQLQPDEPRPAVGLLDAVQDRFALGRTDLGLDRPLERADDVARSDAGRITREHVTAARAALAVHQARLAERGDELFEVGLRKVLALRDGVQRDAALTPVAGEVDHEPHA